MTPAQERFSRPGSALIARAVLVVGYGACSAAWVYADQKQIDLYSQGVYNFLHSTVFLVGILLLLPILVGWHDGSPPLGIPSLVGLFVSGALLLFGVVLHVGAGPRRVDPEDDWTWGK